MPLKVATISVIINQLEYRWLFNIFSIYAFSLQNVETKTKHCIYEPRAYISGVIYLLWKQNDDGKVPAMIKRLNLFMNRCVMNINIVILMKNEWIYSGLWRSFIHT